MAEASSLQDTDKRTSILCALAQVEGANISQLLKTSCVGYWYEKLLCHVARIGKLDPSQTLEIHESIEILYALTQIDSAYFSKALEAAKLIQSELRRAEMLNKLAKYAPDNMLPMLYQAIIQINYKPFAAIALSGYLARLSPTKLSSTNWQSYLHLIAHRTRADLMQNLAALYPAIVHLGGKEAVRGMVDAMREVCSQWK